MLFPTWCIFWISYMWYEIFALGYVCLDVQIGTLVPEVFLKIFLCERASLSNANADIPDVMNGNQKFDISLDEFVESEH